VTVIINSVGFLVLAEVSVKSTIFRNIEGFIIRQKFSNASEEHTTSIFRKKEEEEEGGGRSRRQAEP
jgi:dolichol kinase